MFLSIAEHSLIQLQSLGKIWVDFKVFFNKNYSCFFFCFCNIQVIYSSFRIKLVYPVKIMSIALDPNLQYSYNFELYKKSICFFFFFDDKSQQALKIHSQYSKSVRRRNATRRQFTIEIKKCMYSFVNRTQQSRRLLKNTSSTSKIKKY